MTHAKFELDNYSIRVLDIVKGKFGLKNRTDAINRFIKVHGGEYLDPIINEDYLHELDKKVEEHEKKHPTRKMTLTELDNLLA